MAQTHQASAHPIVSAAAVAVSSEILAPAALYASRPPIFANADLLPASDGAALAQRWGRAAQAAPPITLYRLRDVCVHPVGQVTTAAGEVIAESLHHMKPPQVESFLTAPLPTHSAIRPYPRTCLKLADSGSRNFGHWLIEGLGTLLLVRATRNEHFDVAIRRPRGGGMEKVCQASLQLAGQSWSNVLVLGSVPRRFSELLLVSPVSQHSHMKHPSIVDAVAHLGPSMPAEEKIFVRRLSNTKRVLRNRDAIEEIAVGHGCRVIVPGEMDFAAQIEAFFHAKLVVGVSGAELANIVFMPPGSDVVCLLPARGRESFFWDLCCHRALRYWSLFGLPLTDVGGGHDDFELDPNLLDRTLNAVRQHGGTLDSVRS